jgi:hypothetical protein
VIYFLKLGKTAQSAVYTHVGKIELLRPDPAHDAIREIFLFHVCYILFRYRSRNIIAAPELRRNFFISLPDAELDK